MRLINNNVAKKLHIWDLLCIYFDPFNMSLGALPPKVQHKKFSSHAVATFSNLFLIKFLSDSCKRDNNHLSQH